MKHISTILIALFLLTSCIPLRIAPNIKDDKIQLAKRFKRSLPKQYAFIFNDPKDADDFYYFVNAKYHLNHEAVEDNIPFKVDGKEFLFSFYEVERVTSTINLLPMFIDVALGTNDNDLIFQDLYSSRKGHWYIALTAKDAQMQDCLHPNYPDREMVIKHLRNLRIQYLNTHNYVEAALKD